MWVTFARKAGLGRDLRDVRGRNESPRPRLHTLPLISNGRISLTRFKDETSINRHQADVMGCARYKCCLFLKITFQIGIQSVLGLLQEVN